MLCLSMLRVGGHGASRRLGWSYTMHTPGTVPFVWAVGGKGLDPCEDTCPPVASSTN